MIRRTVQEIADFFDCKAERVENFIFSVIVYESKKAHEEGRFMSICDSGNLIKGENEK